MENENVGEYVARHRPISSWIFLLSRSPVLMLPLAQSANCGDSASFLANAIISAPALLRKTLHHRATVVGSTPMSSDSSSMVCVLKQMPVMAASLTTSSTRAYGMMKHGKRACDVLQLLQYIRRIEKGPNG